MRACFIFSYRRAYALNYLPNCVILFLPACTSGVFVLFISLPALNLQSTISDAHLFSFFNTSPVWYLFFLMYFFLLYLFFMYGGHVVFLSSIFFCQFFFLNVCFTVERIAFFPTLNPLLINPLNYLHPLILSTTYVFTFSVVLRKCLFTVSFVSLRSVLLHLVNFLRLFFYLLFWVFLALLLGLFWAMQLDTWGGWWAWDASEVLLLQLLCLCALILHTHSPNFNYLWLELSCFAFSYYLLAWGFVFVGTVLTFHTFNVSLSFFPNHFIFLAAIFFCLFRYCFKLFYCKWDIVRIPTLSCYHYLTTSLFYFIYSSWSNFSTLLIYSLFIAFRFFSSQRFVILFVHLVVCWLLYSCFLNVGGFSILSISPLIPFWNVYSFSVDDFIQFNNQVVFLLRAMVIDQALSLVSVNTESRSSLGICYVWFWL